MKKLLLLISIFLLIGCDKKEEVKAPQEEDTSKEEVIEKIPQYVDNNSTKIGLYKRANGARTLINDIKGTWGKYVDVTVLSVFLTDKPSINDNTIKSIWNGYSNIENLKIGYCISFTKSDGEKINHIILSPTDTGKSDSYFYVYVYDDIHQSGFYSHLTEGDENTIMTTIKLTTATHFNDIVSPIKLTVFSYDGEDDFDPDTKLYRGNSSFTTTINIEK